MMGKQASKHADCYIVNGSFSKALEEQLIKQTKATGLNLANYNINHHSISELSISVEDIKGDNHCNTTTTSSANMPLRVELPPQTLDTDASKLFAFDQGSLEKTQTKNKNLKEDDAPSKLNIEEFECGVQFGSSENNKQEWSFTLYDFDGHGKVTKEDLSSLLKALYDAIGSSIKIPSNGTKTLKLRLTVGQDGSQLSDTTLTQGKGNQFKVKDISKEKTKETKSPKSKEFAKMNNLTRTQVKIPLKCNNSEAQARNQGQGNQSQGQGQATLGQNEVTDSCNKRLTCVEHQELAELVQENMERNRIKQLRRHHSDCKGSTHDHSNRQRKYRSQSAQHASKYNKNNKNAANNINNTKTPIAQVTANTTTSITTPESPSAEPRAKESQDRRNYYADLVGVDHNAICQSFTNNQLKAPSSAPQCDHRRSHSYDLSRKAENKKQEHQSKKDVEPAEPVTETVVAQHLRSRSFDPQEVATARSPKVKNSSPQKLSRFRPVSLPLQIPETGGSHYHRRHRHREKDHSLAMQKVAEWIESEHAWEVVQRHEHHHIHEHHHHHHYHHYYEA